MTIAERLDQLRQEKLRIIADYEKIERARFSETITDDEYRYLLQQQFGGLTKQQQLRRLDQKIAVFERYNKPMTPDNRQHPYRVAAFIIIIVGLFAGLFMINGYLGDYGITGFASYEATASIPMPIGQVFTKDANFTINVSNMLGLQASGTLRGGRATISAVIDGIPYTVTTIDSNNSYSLTTDKSVYTLGETVAISVLPAPEEATYYAYIGEESYPIAGDTFVPPQTGEYRLDALITEGDKVLKESITFTVTNRTNTTMNNTEYLVPEASFVEQCVDTCSFTEPIQGEITIIIDVQGGELELGELAILTPRENQAPVQITALPDLTLDQPATINLNTYFDDPDGDTITYEINNMIGVDERIDGNILTLNGTIPGNYTTYIYASDTIALTQSETFTVIVPEPITETPPMNGTTNETINETIHINETIPINETIHINETGTINETISTNGTTTVTNTTGPPVVNETTTNQTTNVNNSPELTPCDDPNINLRPDYCFADEMDIAYEEIVAPLKNKKLETVGRATRYGNLIIRGLLRQESTATPGADDFAVGYKERQGLSKIEVTTVWIDSDSGDLHLRGKIHQEQTALQPPQYNSYVIQNSNGLILGYIDELTGDLYLKGNIVQLGKV